MLGLSKPACVTVNTDRNLTMGAFVPESDVKRCITLDYASQEHRKLRDRKVLICFRVEFLAIVSMTERLRVEGYVDGVEKKADLMGGPFADLFI